MPNAIELFSGAGGLAIALKQLNIHAEKLVEWDSNCCETLRANGLFSKARLFEGDVRDVHFTPYQDKVALLAGGPPCQPFSLGGKHKGQADLRNCFPDAIRAIKEIRPKAFLFENVRGLTRAAFRPYLDYLLLWMRYPEIGPRENEDWPSHRIRLEKAAKSASSSLQYKITWQVLNAADFGVPQHRHRVFFVGIRSDLEFEFKFPSATHSEESLRYEQLVSKRYWERHKVSKRERELVLAKLGQFRCSLDEHKGVLEPWRTVRDAIHDLPDPRKGSLFANHEFRAGAKVYPGHTGSAYDEPSKALKAGDHGVPGGENMIAYPDGSVRYYTIREAARIQTFPDDYVFQGAWSEAMRQLGNAVPVLLGRQVAKQLVSLIEETHSAIPLTSQAKRAFVQANA